MKIAGIILFFVITAGGITSKASPGKLLWATGNLFAEMANQPHTANIKPNNLILKQSSNQLQLSEHKTITDYTKISQKNIVQLLVCSGKFREFVCRNNQDNWFFRLPTSFNAFRSALQAVSGGLNTGSTITLMKPQAAPLAIIEPLVQCPCQLPLSYSVGWQYRRYCSANDNCTNISQHFALNFTAIIHRVASVGILQMQHADMAIIIRLKNSNKIPCVSYGYKPGYEQYNIYNHLS